MGEVVRIVDLSISDPIYLPEQRATLQRLTIETDQGTFATTHTVLDRYAEDYMRKTKKKQLMIMAKALFLNQPTPGQFSLRQIAQRLKDVLKRKG